MNEFKSSFFWYNTYVIGILTKKNSPQCRWLAAGIYPAASRIDKYQPIATSTSAKSCFNNYWSTRFPEKSNKDKGQRLLAVLEKMTL